MKVGTRLGSRADSTEVVVVGAPDDDVDLRCGGHPMVELGAAEVEQSELQSQFASGSLLGKRYVDDSGALELLCTKAGPGSLSVGAEALSVKEAKPLPSSD